MLLAMAVLLFHPQMEIPMTFSADNNAEASAEVALADNGAEAENSLPTLTATASLEAAADPAPEASAPLPSAPMPLEPVAEPASFAFIKPANRYTVSVGELRAENRRKQLLWRGLAIATSGAATFDAWTTRHAITTTGAVELNPLLKPFASNSSIYAAIQVTPLLFDFAARKMMYSRHAWVRRVWWVPQTASLIGSLTCGAHNLAFH